MRIISPQDLVENVVVIDKYQSYNEVRVCKCGRSRYLQHLDGDFAEWMIMQSAIKAKLCCFLYCPYCGTKLNRDGSIHLPVFSERTVITMNIEPKCQNCGICENCKKGNHLSELEKEILGGEIESGYI